MNSVRRMKLQVVLQKSEEGGFTVFVPALPGCVSEGATREVALANIREAIELYLAPAEIDLPENAKLVEVTVG